MTWSTLSDRYKDLRNSLRATKQQLVVNESEVSAWYTGRESRALGSAGFTIIEVLIAVFVVSTAIVGVFGLFALGLRLAGESENRLMAIALANEKMELIRNLPYVDVGTQGGIPDGAILQEESVVINSVSFLVETYI